MSGNPMADFLDFMKTSELQPSREVALVEAFKAAQPKPEPEVITSIVPVQ